MRLTARIFPPRHAGTDVDAMLAIAKAYKERSLQDFQAALSAHEAQLMGDPIVRAHLSALYDTLLEGNLARLIEPFSRVEIAHLAELIHLPKDLVLNKLSQARLASLSPAASCRLHAGPWKNQSVALHVLLFQDI